MPSADWCVWCNKVLRGKVSYFFGLCSKCRNTKEGKKFIEKMEKDNFQEQLKLNSQRRNNGS